MKKHRKFDFTPSSSETCTITVPFCGKNKCPPYVTSSLPSDAIPNDSCDTEESCPPRRCRDRQEYPRRPCSRRSECDMDWSFLVMITPLTNVIPVYGTGHNGLVKFTFRRKNKVVTLQWEPFTASVGANGAAAMIINQCVSGMPAYPLDLPVSMTYAGVAEMTVLTVDPFASQQLMIYFHLNKSGAGILIGDSISVPGACVSWISAD